MPRRPQSDEYEQSGHEPAADDDNADHDGAIDPEGPDESEMDSHDDPDLDVCPHCRKMISEEAERCPHCGNYISLEDAPLSTRAWIAIGLVVLLVLAFLISRF